MGSIESCFGERPPDPGEARPTIEFVDADQQGAFVTLADIRVENRREKPRKGRGRASLSSHTPDRRHTGRSHRRQPSEESDVGSRRHRRHRRRQKKSHRSETRRDGARAEDRGDPSSDSSAREHRRRRRRHKRRQRKERADAPQVDERRSGRAGTDEGGAGSAAAGGRASGREAAAGSEREAVAERGGEDRNGKTGRRARPEASAGAAGAEEAGRHGGGSAESDSSSESSSDSDSSSGSDSDPDAPVAGGPEGTARRLGNRVPSAVAEVAAEAEAEAEAEEEEEEEDMNAPLTSADVRAALATEADESAQWTQLSSPSERRVQVWNREAAGDSPATLRTKAYFFLPDFSPAEVFDALFVCGRRRRWDVDYVALRSVEELRDGTEVLYSRFRSKAPGSSDQDFVDFRKAVRQPDGSFVIVFKEATHERCPPDPDCTRCRTLFSANIIRPAASCPAHVRKYMPPGTKTVYFQLGQSEATTSVPYLFLRLLKSQIRKYVVSGAIEWHGLLMNELRNPA